MQTLARVGLLAAGGFTLLLAAGLLLQVPFITAMWPWPESPLTYVLAGAVQAAIAAALIYIAVAREWSPLAAGGLNAFYFLYGLARPQ